MKAFLLIHLSLLTVLISAARVQGQLTTSKTSYNPIRTNGKIHPQIKGHWKSIGNGYILDATSDSVLLYTYTRHFCYKEKNDHLEERLNSQARFFRHNDTISIYMADYGEKTFDLQIKHDYVKIDRLPENTIGFSAMQQLPSKQLFDLFIENLQENYAFSKERQLNWDAIRTEYGGKLSDTATRNQLFQVMGDIVKLTKDQHTKIIDTNGRTLQYSGIRTANIVIDSFNNQSAEKNLNNYFNLFFNTNYKNISDSLLQMKGQKVANKKIEWGSLDKDIGYISIFSFTGFTAGKSSRRQEIDSLNQQMELIIRSLKDKKAIIIDVSFNFGGFDATAFTIAGFFTKKPVYAYTSQVYNNGSFYNESKVYIQPSGQVTYTKPVYVLMTDISRSAAEGFAMAMDALPNVTLVGTRTLGTLSGMLGKSVGDFYSTSSNQRLLTAEGKYYEVSGVSPDIELIVFPRDNVFEGHKEAVREIMKMILKK